MTLFRDLTEDEIAMVHGGTIVVTGTRPSPVSPIWGGGGRWSSRGAGNSSGASDSSVDPECTCSLHGYTGEQVLDIKADSEAAEVLREINSKANQNMEYGSIIYVGTNGEIMHTPLISSPDFRTRLDYSALPKNADGTPDYSSVIGMVHSHPHYLTNGTGGLDNYYDPSDPDYLLTPSNRTDMPDDWDVYDSFIANITHDGGDASLFSMYVAGFDGSKLVLKEYTGSDRGTTNGNDGDSVSADAIDPGVGCLVHGF